jgi:biopolymer transport protein ExbD
MKRPPYRGTPRDSLEMMMTPMIDVVFLLIVFFVWTASFSRPEHLLDTEVASASGGEPAEVQPPPPDLDRIIVEVGWRASRPAWTIYDRELASLAEVSQTLRAAAGIDNALPVILVVDGRVPMGDVIDVYDLSRAAGFVKIQFAANVQKS